mgnify:CR=1 FL=1
MTNTETKIKVQLGTEDYDINGITINQWEVINKWDEEKTKWTNSDLISLILGVNIEQVKKATLQQINFVGNFLQNYITQKSQKESLKMLVKKGDEMLGLVKPSQLTYGEYVDLETLMALKPLNLKHIAAILYRPTLEYNEETGESKIVPYDYNECLERAEGMGNMLIGDVFSSIFFLIKYNQTLAEDSVLSLEKKMKMKAG